MPLVGIDCRFAGSVGGLGTYTRGIVSSLLKRNDAWSYVLFVDDEQAPWLRDIRDKQKTRIVEAPFAPYSLAEQLEFPNLLQDAALDLLFFPHFNVPLSCSVPFVCTIHDLILHRFSNGSRMFKRLMYRFVMRQALSRAQSVIAVSDYTKSDLRSVHGAKVDRKTSVIYPGISSAFTHQHADVCSAFRLKHDLENPFLLYIGNAKEHKNVDVLLEAYRQSGLSGIDLVLLTGGRESARLRRSDGVRFLTGLPESELPLLLSSARACVTATLLEGFCLPLIEAMACRTPVLGTWSGAIPEVCGSHALLVEPTVSSVCEGLRSIALDSSFRDASRLHAAEVWAKAYTWERAAEGMAEVIGGNVDV